MIAAAIDPMMMATPAIAANHPTPVHTREMVACVFAVLPSPESPDVVDCRVIKICYKYKIFCCGDKNS